MAKIIEPRQAQPKLSKVSELVETGATEVGKAPDLVYTGTIRSWQQTNPSVGKQNQSWQKLTKVGKSSRPSVHITTEVGKAPDPHRLHRSWQQTSLTPCLREYSSNIYFLAGKLFLQLVYLADNLQ